MMKSTIISALLLGLLGLTLATRVTLPGINDVEFDATELEALSDQFRNPELNHRRALKADYVGCKYYPGYYYTGDNYRIHDISIYYANATVAQEACCNLCYYVKNCRKQTLSKSTLLLVTGGNEIATCSMYTKKAKRKPPGGGIGFVTYTAGVLIV